MQCIYCSIIVDSCADQLQDHVVEHCKSITQEDRAEAQKHVDVTINTTAGQRQPIGGGPLSRTSIEKE